MKKLITLVAVAWAIIALTPATVSAQAFTLDQLNLELNQHLKFNWYENNNRILVIAPELQAETPDPEPEKPSEPETIVHTVVKGDNLSKIGTTYNVEWQRLWAKNTNIKHPDVIYVGDKITIPKPSEQLERELPAVVALPAVTPGVDTSKAPVHTYGGSNTYSAGYCTWYVKNRRGASLPNGLGNANTWYSRAQAAGMATGVTPKAGAVGTTTRGQWGHVVYVESVNADGTINISDMNYRGLYQTTYRTVSASQFVYIY